MKSFKDFLNYGATFLLSIAFMIALLTGCSQGSEDQATQEENVTQQDVQQEEAATAQTESNEVMQETEEEVQADNTQPAQSPQTQATRNEPDKPELQATSLSYRKLDANSDDILNKDELFGGLLSAWDEDGNNTINENEFNTATQNFFARNEFNEYGSFGNWDKDGNNEISEQEFRDTMASIIDIDQNERLAQNLLIIWDLDNDDKIERVELDNITVMLDENDN